MTPLWLRLLASNQGSKILTSFSCRGGCVGSRFPPILFPESFICTAAAVLMKNRSTLLETAVHSAAAQSQWVGQIGLWRSFSCWGWRSTVISLMTLIMSPVSAHYWVNSHTHKCIALPYMLTSWDFIHAFISSDCLSCTLGRGDAGA